MMRSAETEVIDRAAGDISYDDYAAAFRAVAWTNRLFGGYAAVIRAVARVARERRLSALKILDVGCGGGDVCAALATWARRAGVRCEIDAVDSHPHAAQLSSETLREFPEVSVRKADFFELEEGGGAVRHARPSVVRAGASLARPPAAPAPADPDRDVPYDITVSSLLLHHLSEDDVIRFFLRARELSRHAAIAADLRRSALGHALTSALVIPFAPKSGIFAHDALASFRRAYTPSELRRMLSQAGIDARVAVPWHSPFRLTVTTGIPEMAICKEHGARS